jgi:hypothetical protein
MEKGEGTQLALTGMLLFLAGKKRSDGKLSTSCNFNKATYIKTNLLTSQQTR